MKLASAGADHDRCSYWERRAISDDPHQYQWDEYDLFVQPPAKNFSVPFSSVLDHAKQLSLFVDIDPDVIGGTPRVGGTRIPVHMVLNAIEEYGTIDGAARAYRSLTEEQIRDAIRFSAHVLECPFEY
jgi:uncharacterized protein (DUF433 family)